MIIAFREVSSEWGWLGNMSPVAVQYTCQHGTVQWRTAEHLFQALRLPEGHRAIADILAAKSPMQAKIIVNSYPQDFIYIPRSGADITNMRRVLEAKIDQHEYLRELLRQTNDAAIVEDETRRAGRSGALFWGAALREHGWWEGANMLGRLWMSVREQLPTRKYRRYGQEVLEL